MHVSLRLGQSVYDLWAQEDGKMGCTLLTKVDGNGSLSHIRGWHFHHKNWGEPPLLCYRSIFWSEGILMQGPARSAISPHSHATHLELDGYKRQNFVEGHWQLSRYDWCFQNLASFIGVKTFSWPDLRLLVFVWLWSLRSVSRSQTSHYQFTWHYQCKAMSARLVMMRLWPERQAWRSVFHENLAGFLKFVEFGLWQRKSIKLRVTNQKSSNLAKGSGVKDRSGI